MYKLPLLLGALLLTATSALAQDFALNFTRTRPPAFDATKYKQVGTGDIVGPLGGATQSSLNVTDDLAVDLVKLQTPTCEVLDHNALNRLYGTKSSTTPIINETTMASLAKKTQSAILLVGRIQNETVNQELKTASGAQDCPTQYWYESFGDFTLQVKVFDIRTAKLLHAEVIKVPMTAKTERKCQKGGPLEETQLQRKAAEAAALQIAHMLFPYEEALRIELWHPLLGNPFKNTRNAAALFNSGDHVGSLDILQGYTTDAAIKEKSRPWAFYNYGAGLYADGQFSLAKEQFLKAYGLLPTEIAFKNIATAMDKELQLSAAVAASTAKQR